MARIGVLHQGFARRSAPEGWREISNGPVWLPKGGDLGCAKLISCSGFCIILRGPHGLFGTTCRPLSAVADLG